MVYKKTVSVLLCIALMMSLFAFSSFAGGDITIVSPPSQTTFYQGIDWNYVDGKIVTVKSLDLTGTVLSYNSKTVTFNPHTQFGANMTAKSMTGSWVEGKNTVKITCTEFSSSVYATLDVDFVKLTGVSLKNPPVKTDLYMGIDWQLGVLNDVEIQSLDLTGTKITAQYTGSLTKEISYPNSAIDWSIGDADTLFPGKNTLYITFCGYELPFEVNFLKEKPVIDFLPGDVNMDNRITSFDALLVLEYVTGSVQLSSIQLELADVCKDNQVNSTDALYILQAIVGIITL